MRNRPAVSLVEVLVALVLFSVAALGSAAAIGVSARAQMHARWQREAFGALRTRAALLDAAACAAVVSDTSTTDGVSVAQTVVAADSLMTVVLSAVHHGVPAQLRTEVACD